MTNDLRLICPHHADDRVVLLEVIGEDDLLECPQCDFTCPNYQKYPVRQVIDLATGAIVEKNIITGEVIA